MAKHLNPTWVKIAAPMGMRPRQPDPMQDYQRRVVEKLKDPRLPGLVVAHGTGTGKTRTSIEAYKAMGMPTHVVPPAALQDNYRKEIGRWIGKQPTNLTIQSQQRAALSGLPRMNPNSMLIVDEAHRAREMGSKLMQSLRESQAKKKLLLTATPVFNHPKDLASLVNLAANRKMLPTDKNEFNAEYVQPIERKPSIFQRMMGVKPGLSYDIRNPDKLKKILNRYVDYQPGVSKGFPDVKQETVKVPMGDKQMDIYKAIMGQAPMWVRWKVKAGLPPGKGELDTLRAFLSGARQVSNTSQGFTTKQNDVESAKIEQAYKYFQQQYKANPRYKAVVYSNYLNSGLNPYKQMLEKSKIPYGEFHGNISPGLRNKMVQDYNANKLKALLVSSAGSEGLDLKGTRLVQILEPHFNEEKEKQIIGRGARYQSHAGLSPEEQNVLVQRYLAQPKPSFMDRMLGYNKVTGTDEYIRNLALQKNELNRKILELMQEK